MRRIKEWISHHCSSEMTLFDFEPYVFMYLQEDTTGDYQKALLYLCGGSD